MFGVGINRSVRDFYSSFWKSSRGEILQRATAPKPPGFSRFEG